MVLFLVVGVRVIIVIKFTQLSIIVCCLSVVHSVRIIIILSSIWAREVSCIWTVGRIAVGIVSIWRHLMHFTFVIRRRLSPDSLNVNRIKSVNTVPLCGVIRLHLKY